MTFPWLQHPIMDYNTSLLLIPNKRGWNFYEVNNLTLIHWMKTSLFGGSDETRAREKAEELNKNIKAVYKTGYSKILVLDKLPCRRTLKKLLNENN